MTKVVRQSERYLCSSSRNRWSALAGMGGRIFIVDRHKRNLGRKGSDSGATVALSLAPLLAVALATVISLARRH